MKEEEEENNIVQQIIQFAPLLFSVDKHFYLGLIMLRVDFAIVSNSFNKFHCCRQY